MEANLTIAAFLALLVLIIIIQSIVSIKKDQLKKESVYNNMMSGDQFYVINPPNHPFEEDEYVIVNIIEKKDGYIKYSWADGSVSVDSIDRFIDWWGFKKMDEKQV